MNPQHRLDGRGKLALQRRPLDLCLGAGLRLVHRQRVLPETVNELRAHKLVLPRLASALSQEDHVPPGQAVHHEGKGQPEGAP